MLEKKFWLVGFVVWLIIQVPIGFQPLFFLIYAVTEESLSVGFAFGALLGTLAKIAIIAHISSWIWKKYKLFHHSVDSPQYFSTICRK